MTAFMDDLARASWPVAILLLIFAGTARALLWAQVDDPDALRIARQYLEPLATWSVVAVATHVLALGAAGDLAVSTLVLPLVVGAVAMLLRAESAPKPAAEVTTPARTSASAAAPVPARAAAPAPAPAPARASAPAPAPRRAASPAPTGSLWAGRETDEPTREGSLWSH